MFAESIIRIGKVKKFISKKIATDLADEPWILNYLEDTTYQLSMIQEQLNRVNKILKERGKHNDLLNKDN